MTKLIKTDEDLDLEFQPPAPGTYRWEIIEGVKLSTNPNSGKQTYHVPMQIDSAFDGDESAKGARATHFIPIETQFGENQMNTFINITDSLDVIIDRFGEEVDFLDKTVAEFVALRFMGKFVKAAHKLRAYTDNDGNARQSVDFKKFFAPTKKAPVKVAESGENKDW